MLNPIESLPYAEPESVGMSSARLARIRPVMQCYVDQSLVPGVVTMVARHGKVVHFDVCGYKNVEQQAPMQKDTVFRIASMTKPMTSLALMMLLEEGKLQLHDPVANYLPVFADMKVRVKDDKGQSTLVPAKRKINIRHLLTHTAGFSSEYAGKTDKEYMEIVQPRNREGTINDFVNRLAAAPLKYEPGSTWDYSRATCVVGRLVEVISGKSLKDFFQERILDPLGMVDTHFFLPQQKWSRFSCSYTPGDDNKIKLEDPDTEESFFLSQDSEFYIGSGGLVSTATDYFRFAEMLRRGGNCDAGRLVSRKTMELMTTNHTGDKFVWLTGFGYGFGLGFGIMLDQGVSHAIISPGSYSWGGMYCTHWWNDPKEQLFGMTLTQVRPYLHLNIRADMQAITTSAIID